MWGKWVKPAYDIFAWDFWFGQVNARPLGLFRIAFALLLLKDALYHLPLAHIFYSDEGIAPRSIILHLVRAYRISFLDMIGADWQITLFFCVWIVVVIMLLLGYHTRLMTILNWLIILSIHERNIWILNGADTVLRVLSLWAIFLPLGRAYSLDRLRLPDLPTTTLAFPLRMVQIQIALIYLFTFILKTYGGLWWSGEAVYHALQLRSFTHATGDWAVSNLPFWSFQVSAYATLVAEGLFFVLVFLPILQPYARLLGLAMVTLMHVGIGVLMAVPNFSILMITSYLLFVEGDWIVWLKRKLFPNIGYESEHLPDNPPRLQSLALVLITGSLLFTIVGWNLWHMRPDGKSLSPPLSDIQFHTIQTLGLWQVWDMFAPNPTRTDAAMIIEGHFADGRQVDLRTGDAYSNDIPRFYFGYSARWKKYGENLYENHYTDLFQSWLHVMCREYKNDNLLDVQLIYRYRQTHDYGAPENPYVDDPLWKLTCPQ